MSNNMSVIENKLVIDENTQKYIDFVLSNNFPLFYTKTVSEKFMMYGHILVNRQKKDVPIEGQVNSNEWVFLKPIFDNFCVQNNIKYKTILRAAINSTSHYANEHFEIHVDHSFEHNNFIFYLNDFSGGETLIFDKNDNIIHTIKPEKYKGVVFSGLPHAHRFCGVYERRVVFVVTFI